MIFVKLRNLFLASLTFSSLQLCPDIYWYPLISETFAKELMEEMEHYDKWNSGKNEDDRIDGGCLPEIYT